MDMEDELRRLFQDDRLDVQVAAGADRIVVAGARRVRRRRVALVSAAAAVCAVGLAAGAILIIGPTPASSNEVAGQPWLPITAPESSPADLSATRPPSALSGVMSSEPTSPSKVSQPPPKPGTTVATSMTSKPPTAMALGPTGYGEFRLGMSETDLVATGQVQLEVRTDACTQYRIKSTAGGGYVEFSQAHGLVNINPATSSTPEHITVGSTTQQVKDTYPDFTGANGPPQAKVPGNANAVYRFMFTGEGKVSGIQLHSNDYDCAV
jgi:hypothetical protein